MNRLLNYLPLHFLTCLILGICIQFYYTIWHFNFLTLPLLLCVSWLLLLLIKNKKLITFLSFISFFLIGVSTVFFNNDVNYNSYYQKHLQNDVSAVFKINKVLKPGLYYNKYQAKVTQIGNTKTKGTILLNIQKDSFSNSLKVDELIVTKPEFKDITAPLNPHQFNYKNYVLKKGIHQQLFLENTQIKRAGFSTFSFLGLSSKFRAKILGTLKNNNFKKDELAVINALLLGQRQDISRQLITNYSNAGAIHILAISGLHVGIILLILSWLFKPLEKLKNGRFFKTILMVLFLWMFAFIAGLSASVVRAVTMFTFLVIGLSFQQKRMIEFSLISSMFLLLIIKPMFLFDVGFQLSYSAVFGIIWVQPKLYAIVTPRLKLADKFWQLFTVSIAAQAGILPLSLYYFHQFPGLFIVSNLVIIPFLGAILVGGIIVIVCSLIGILPQFIASIYGFVISSLNLFVSWISNQEQFLFKEISLSFLKMIFLYALIIFGIRFLHDTAIKKVYSFLFAILFFQGVVLFENHQQKSKKEFIVFHKYKETVIGARYKNHLQLYIDANSEKIKNRKLLKSYKIGENIDGVSKKNEIGNILQFKNQQFLIVDQLGIYQVNNLKNPIVILRNSPKINLTRLIKFLKPLEIIADGSNYNNTIKRWKKICVQEKTPFYITGKNGAYIFVE